MKIIFTENNPQVAPRNTQNNPQGAAPAAQDYSTSASFESDYSDSSPYESDYSYIFSSDSDYSDSFSSESERSLRQGDSLAGLLFNPVLDKCVRDSGLDRSGTLCNRSLQLLAYADDIDIIGRYEKAVKEAFQALEISATNMGLTINVDKTNFMEALPSSVNTYFFVNGHSFERVSEFKYLGTIINDQNNLKAEINNRIKSANKCFFGIKKQLRSKFISGKTKLRLYKTLILRVLLYASETWTRNLETIRALETFEIKAMITILGSVKDQGC
ncbi:reverse transcriptase domain-containing protein [Trichonephila clavipes]|uniref:Reverse transcriptase domain-containing protein n=1 Tax=Trichonephila clavipes TaxID=2585209 RepID=A0A8X6VDQ3_TRICX|nr:reverse transcriptase domain-containing protein [Trichonephila clavipes]